MKKDISQKTVLIVDDDKFFSDVLRDDLTYRDLHTTVLHSISEARQLCSQKAFDIVLLDNQLPDGSGLSLIPNILSLNDRTKIILITAFPSFNNAVQAIKDGAYDYISKPIDLEELHVTIERALHASSLEAVEQVVLYQTDKDRENTSLIGFKNSFQEIHNLINRSATTNAPVLITGETGTGKNVIAKAIHYQSEIRTKPFINLNCAAIPETLIEAELFGVEKGAFTGAIQTRKGVFELADDGTLFLDEIGEMPISLQAKLLGALEDRQIKRVGAEKSRSVNVRIIAATNALSEDGFPEDRFRKDLFYRLSVIRIHLPPLRERTEDIPDLCQHFIKQFAPNRHIKIPAEEVEFLKNYNFPGNVRELRNIIERSLLLHEGNFIYPSKIINITNNGKTETQKIKNNSSIDETFEKDLSLAEVERQYILAKFSKHNNNIAQTAKAIDVSLSTLKRKLREFGVR